MTQATISRDTLFWRDQIVYLRVSRVEAEAVLRKIAIQPNTSGSVAFKDAKYNLRQVTKSLEFAVSNFADSAFMDVRGVK